MPCQDNYSNCNNANYDNSSLYAEINDLRSKLCAVISEAERQSKNIELFLLSAEQNGHCSGIAAFWHNHRAEDKRRIELKYEGFLKQFSDHEKKLLSQIILNKAI